MYYGDEMAEDATLLHRTYLKIYELESKNILFSNRWRQDDGTFLYEDHRNAYLFDLIVDNHACIERLMEDLDELVEAYPAFVILPLLRALGSLTVRILKGISAFEGALLSVWKVMKRLEKHTASNTQAENGWAVVRSTWAILLKALEDNDLDTEQGLGGGQHPTQPF